MSKVTGFLCWSIITTGVCLFATMFVNYDIGASRHVELKDGTTTPYLVLSVQEGSLGRHILAIPRRVVLKPTMVESRYGKSVPDVAATVTGVDVEKAEAHLPMRPENTSGPSGGLAEVLAVIDATHDGDLSGGNLVAATGMLGENGAVHMVGGLVLKMEAAVAAGATVIFVPAVQQKEALEVVGGRALVFGVTTVSEAIEHLHALGGSGVSDDEGKVATKTVGEAQGDNYSDSFSETFNGNPIKRLQFESDGNVGLGDTKTP